MADYSATNAIIGATASAVGQNLVNVAQSKRQWGYQQAAMDKQQALNRETWDMQNAYNTPQMQMERLQEAGLNPRLIYGEGSSAPNMASPPDVAQAPTRNVPDLKVPDLMNYYNVRQADAQYKQTVMATDIMQKTAGLKDIETALQNLKLVKENQRAPNYQSMAILETDLKYFAAQRARMLFENEGRKGALMDQLGDMRRKQMTSIDLDNEFKQNRNALAKYGIYSTDHPAFRALISGSQRMNMSLSEMLKSGIENLGQYLKPGK